MSACPNCNEHVEPGAAFCGACGHRLAGMGTAPAADPLVGMVIDGRYRIIDLIGRGGMGAVYRVEHVKMGKIMALKLLHGELSLDSDVVRRFQREARAASKLSHVNNVSIFDFGSHQGMMYLVMEYIDGRDLSEVLREEGALPVNRVLEILAQVCSGLMDAHAQGIVHRDLKPENIISSQMADQPELIKVVDFGLAKLRAGKAGTKITQQGSLVGTPFYMAPEHIREEEVDARTDVYALGAVMHKLITGETPFTAGTPMGVITKHLTENVPPPSARYPHLNIPAGVDEVILTAMKKDPAERYQSVESMRSALADLAVVLNPATSLGRFSTALPSLNAAPPVDPSPSHSQAGPSLTPVITHLPKEPVSPSAPPLPEQPQAAIRTRTGPSTITVGAREMYVGTKSDVIRFEKSMRAKRFLSFALLGLLLLGLAGAGVYFFVFHGRDDSVPTMETEPNDGSGSADTLTPAVQLAGRLGGNGPGEDLDWYRLNGPPQGKWAVEVNVTAVAGADIALQLVDPARKEPIAVANRGPAGHGEDIYPTIVEVPTLFLVVQEVRRPGVPPGNFAATPYGVVFRMFDPTTVEAEPNDQMKQATPVRLMAPVQGRFEGVKDTDWYCLPTGLSVSTVQVTGPSSEDVVLVISQGSKTTRVDSAPIGAGETAQLTTTGESVCVSVTRKAGSSQAVSPPYQVFFQ